MQTTRRRRPGGRRFFPRRKVCQFCVDKLSVDYKDVGRNRRFISEWGKIESRRKTGTCSPHQRQLALAIKRARYLALLPYTGSHSLLELSRPDPRGDRGRRPFRPPGSGYAGAGDSSGSRESTSSDQITPTVESTPSTEEAEANRSIEEPSSEPSISTDEPISGEVLEDSQTETATDESDKTVAADTPAEDSEQ